MARLTEETQKRNLRQNLRETKKIIPKTMKNKTRDLLNCGKRKFGAITGENAASSCYSPGGRRFSQAPLQLIHLLPRV
jgi:hypothetical protein